MNSEVIPLIPGYYWAKHRIPAKDTFEGDLICPSDEWEIVQVHANRVDWENDPAESEALSVSVTGVREVQWRDCFIWGNFIAPLKPAIGQVEYLTNPLNPRRPDLSVSSGVVPMRRPSPVSRRRR